MQNKRIKIAIVAGKMNAGGVESIILSHLKNLDKNIFDIDILVDEDSNHIPETLNNLVNNIYIVPPYQKLKSYNKKLKEIFTNNKYDIVHSHINTLSIFPLRIAKKCGVKIRISHSHSSLGKGEFKRNVLKRILRLFSKKYATHYFACSASTGIFQFGKKTFNKGLVDIIPNSIDTTRFIYNKDFKKEYNNGELKNKFVIGHVGRFETVKNHKFLLQILAKLVKKDAKYHLFLVGDGKLFEETKAYADDLNISKQVTFLGSVFNPEIYYSLFDLFVLPSLYEGFPVTAIEAQTNGLTCLYSSRINREIDILNNAKFIDLEINSWYDEIINSNNDRIPNSNKIIYEKGYDDKSSVKILENKYLEIING